MMMGRGQARGVRGGGRVKFYCGRGRRRSVASRSPAGVVPKPITRLHFQDQSLAAECEFHMMCVFFFAHRLISFSAMGHFLLTKTTRNELHRKNNRSIDRGSSGNRRKLPRFPIPPPKVGQAT